MFERTPKITDLRSSHSVISNWIFSIILPMILYYSVLTSSQDCEVSLMRKQSVIKS